MPVLLFAFAPIKAVIYYLQAGALFGDFKFVKIIQFQYIQFCVTFRAGCWVPELQIVAGAPKPAIFTGAGTHF